MALQLLQCCLHLTEIGLEKVWCKRSALSRLGHGQRRKVVCWSGTTALCTHLSARTCMFQRRGLCLLLGYKLCLRAGGSTYL